MKALEIGSTAHPNMLLHAALYFNCYLCQQQKKHSLTIDRADIWPDHSIAAQNAKDHFSNILMKTECSRRRKKKESKKERESDSKKIIKQQLSIQFVFHVRTTVFRMCNFAQRKRKFWNDFCFFQFFDNHFLYYGSYSTSVDQICIINYFFLFRARNFAVIK